MTKAKLPIVALAVVALGACTHTREGPASEHFGEFRVEPPNKNVVHVCSAYGCKTQTKFRFTDADVTELRTLMKKVKKDDSSFEERRAVAYAIGWIEQRVGKAIGTDKDEAGMDFGASGNPEQQDCVDESTNTTSYLHILEYNGLIKHHTIERPFSKDQLWRGVAGWTHWTAVLKDKRDGKRYAVDSWIYANGENAAVVEVEKWYIEDLASLPASTR